jgi:prepilin-type N-terminal cleavage/methylation domain-containing protein
MASRGFGTITKRVMMKRNQAKRNRLVAEEMGFTLIELLVVIIIMGIISTVGAMSYASTSRMTNMSGAKKQVEEALNRAKTSARQENVTYRIIFYTNPDSSYEFLHNVYTGSAGSGSWSMTPVDQSVTGEKVMFNSGHWYIKVPNGVSVTSPTTTITFSPAGTEMTIEPATINLRIGNITGSVSIDADGKIIIN